MLTPTEITAQANLGDGQVGTLQAKGVVQRTAAEWQNMPVTAELHAQSAGLDLVHPRTSRPSIAPPGTSTRTCRSPAPSARRNSRASSR